MVRSCGVLISLPMHLPSDLMLWHNVQSVVLTRQCWKTRANTWRSQHILCKDSKSIWVGGHVLPLIVTNVSFWVSDHYHTTDSIPGLLHNLPEIGSVQTEWVFGNLLLEYNTSHEWYWISWNTGFSLSIGSFAKMPRKMSNHVILLIM